MAYMYWSLRRRKGRPYRGRVVNALTSRIRSPLLEEKPSFADLCGRAERYDWFQSSATT